MNWLRLRYSRLWHVVELDRDGQDLGAAGPFSWPRAERLRRYCQRHADERGHTFVIRRTGLT